MMNAKDLTPIQKIEAEQRASRTQCTVSICNSLLEMFKTMPDFDRLGAESFDIYAPTCVRQMLSAVLEDYGWTIWLVQYRKMVQFNQETPGARLTAAVTFIRNKTIIS